MCKFDQMIVSGSLAYDYVMSYDSKFENDILPENIDKLSVCFVVSNKERHFGGTAGNIAYSYSLLGGKASIAGRAGRDFDEYKVWLKKHNIDLGAVVELENIDCAAAYITTDQKENQITIFHPGAMGENTEKLNTENLIKGESPLWHIAPDDVGTMILHADYCRDNQISFIFDPGQAIFAFKGEDLKKCIKGAYGLIVNDYELNLLMKKSGMTKKEILAEVEVLVITLGEKGSRIELKDETKYEIPVVTPKEIKDPTGCGDAYRGGFLYGLTQGIGWEEAGKLGAKMASRNIEQVGTQNYEGE